MFKVVVSGCEMFLPFHAGQFCDLHEILVKKNAVHSLSES